MKHMKRLNVWTAFFVLIFFLSGTQFTKAEKTNDEDKVRIKELVNAYENGSRLTEEEFLLINGFLEENKSPRIWHPATLNSRSVVALEEHFTTGALPAGWQNVDVAGNGEVWEFNNPGQRIVNTTTSSDGFAGFDSDSYGNNGTAENADLITPPIDCSALSVVRLQFEHYFRAGFGGAAEVFVSGDNGATWNSIAALSASSTANAQFELYDISSIAAGQSQVLVKWKWTGDFSWYWFVDDVFVYEPSAPSGYAVDYKADAGNPGGLNDGSDTESIASWDTHAGPSNSANFWSQAAAIPFPFEFFGTAVTHFTASQNGLVTFDTTVIAARAVPPNENTNLPSASLPDMTIAVMWDEFTSTPPTGTNDRILTKVYGAPGNQQLWIKWFSFEYGNPNVSFSYFACVLEEGTNNVYVVDMYNSTTPLLTTTVGVQMNSTTALQFGDSLIAQGGNGVSNTDNDYYEFFTPSSDDIGVNYAAATNGFLAFPGEPSTIMAGVKNFGLNPAGSFDVGYSVDDGSSSSVFYNGVLQPGESDTIAFPTTWTPADSGTYEVQVFVTYAIDGNVFNDTATFSQEVILKQVLNYEQDFENYTGNPSTIGWYGANNEDFGTFTPSPTDDGSWTRDDFGNDPSISGDAARFNFFSATVDDKDWLISPPIDMTSGVTGNILAFDIAVTPFTGTSSDFIPAGDTLFVVVSTDGETWPRGNVIAQFTEADTIPPTGKRVFYDLSPYDTETSLHVGFLAMDPPNAGDINVYVDNFFVGKPPGIDVAVTQFLNLPASSIPNSAVNFDVEISNVGGDPLGADTVDIFTNGVITSSYEYGPIDPFQKDTVMASYLSSATGTDTILAAVRFLTGDENPANDTLAASVPVATVVPTPFAENFDALDPSVPDTLPAGWTNETDDVFDWDADAGGTPSTGTGPAVDHTTGSPTGVYMYTEATGQAAGDVAHLTTPFLDLTGLTDPALEFWFHMFGAAMGELHVDLFSGGVWNLDITSPLVGQKQTANEAPWLKATADLSPWAGSVVKIRFRGVIGGDFRSDMAIDDVSVGEASPDIAASSVDAPKLSMMPLTQSGIVSSIVTEGTFTNLGTDNTGDLNVEVSDQNMGSVVFTDVLTGVTINSFSDTSVVFSPWDASSASPGVYDITMFPTSFPDTEASNDTTMSAVTLGTQIAFDRGVQSTNGTFSSTARSWFAVRYSLTDPDTLSSVSILITESTEDSDSFAVELWSTSNDTPRTPMATIFEGTYGQLGTRPVLAQFFVPGGMPLAAGDYAVVFDMKQQTGIASFPCGIDFTAYGAAQIPRTFWGKLETTDWLVFESVGAGTWTPIIRAGFQEFIHDLAVTSIQADACLVYGESTSVRAAVQNVGNQPETNVPVDLYENGVMLASVSVTLDPSARDTVLFTYTPSDTGLVQLTVISNLSSDSNPSNDSAMAYVGVLAVGKSIVFYDGFEDTTFSFTNWIVMDDPATVGTWMIYSEPYPNSYTLPVTSRGNVFAADADEAGSGSTTISTATLPLDLTNYQAVMLEFDSDWNALDTEDTARVNVSGDGGLTWTTVVEYAGVDSMNQHVSLNLTAYLAGSADAWIAFESYQPGWDWWWTLDNVCVSGVPEITATLPFWEGFNDTLLTLPTGWTQFELDDGDELAGADWRILPNNNFPYPILEGVGLAFQNFLAADTNMYIDEWMLTPKVMDYQSGMELSFYGIHDAGPWNDSVMVMVSTTGMDPADFTQIDYINLPTDWTRFSYNLESYGVNVGDDFYVALRYLLYSGGSSGNHSNRLGIDDFHIDFPPGPPPAKLLLTEIVVRPTGAEFIEIYNPSTTDTVNLSNYYLGNCTFQGGNTYYYQLVEGGGGGGAFDDFNARFPDGAWIGPNEYQTVAIQGDSSFFAAYGVLPTYELYEDSSNFANDVPDMREAVPGSINGQGGLTNGDEDVEFYYWDGLNDLVQDVDYLIYDEGDGGINEQVDKTGVRIDGPDADTDSSEYLPDTPIASQVPAPINNTADGFSSHRTDYAEGTQTPGGGNGVTGADETSENLDVTWTDNSIPTPNGPHQPVGIEDIAAIPTTYDISQNYPNPFNPTTTIKYQLPHSSDVQLIIYNALGQKVRTLVTETKEPGYYEVMWDGRNDGGIQVASGIYLYRIKAGEFVRSKKMLLLK
jgi:hypothetical protein